MFGIGSFEFLVILLVAVLVLGPEKLPKVMRTFSKVMSEFRRVKTDFQRTMNAELAQQEYKQMQKDAQVERLKQQGAEQAAAPAGEGISETAGTPEAAPNGASGAESSSAAAADPSTVTIDVSPAEASEESASPRITVDELQRAVSMEDSPEAGAQTEGPVEAPVAGSAVGPAELAEVAKPAESAQPVEKTGSPETDSPPADAAHSEEARNVSNGLDELNAPNSADAVQTKVQS